MQAAMNQSNETTSENPIQTSEKRKCQVRSCSCAIRVDEFNGWACSVSGDSCLFYRPDAVMCAEKYHEGPLANNNAEEEYK